jgi:hypothetical protein
VNPVRSCLVLFLIPGVWAQQNRPAQPLTRASFNASGLRNEKLFTDFFTGNFVDIPFDRENLPFSVLFQQYLESYGRHCDAYLPANKIELTTSVCAAEQTSVDRYGVRSSTCISYRQVGTGIYADPVLYRAQAQLTSEQGISVIKDTLRTLTKQNPFAAAGEALQMSNDMDALLRLNACNSPGLKRFQDNILLFSLGKQPVALSGAAPAAAKQPASPGKNQDYTRLLEDLVAEQAKTWFLNRYVPGSTSGVVVTSRDAEGRPAKIAGKYLFNGRNQGSVTVDFADGVPSCMYFFDFPTTCKTPNRRIVSAYASGGYQ